MMQCPEGYELDYEETGLDNGVYIPKDFPRTKLDDRRYYCKCGCSKFEVFAPKPYYTNVRCINCDRETTVHSG